MITGRDLFTRIQSLARDISLLPMRHTLKLHGVVIGWSDLERIDPELGRARGLFRPGIGYDLVQPVFRLYTEAVPRADDTRRDEGKLERYYKSRDSLALELVDASGQPIPTSAIHIADYRSDGSGDCELDVLIADADYWSRRTPSC